MNRSFSRRIASSALAFGLVSAADPVVAPDEQVRRANAAIESGDLDEADRLYGLAEERSADPGLVAFNRGTVYSRRGDFRRAELSFRRALGDGEIPTERRARALYNLGTCLVKQAGEADVRQLQAAIDCYEMALRETTDEGLKSDAGHNLELAKLLYAKARAKRPPGERDPAWDEPKDPRRPPPDPSRPNEDPGSDTGDAKQLEPGTKLDLGKGKDQGLAPKEAPKPAPGQGNLPVIPDTDEVKSLAPDDARAVLLKETTRIRRERQKLREEAAQGDRPRANDW